jgi:hypothetical protein
MMGINIKEPSTDCKKCYGKGYVGIKVGSNEPVACLCLFDKKDKANIVPTKYTREQRRRIERMQSKILKKIRK